MTQLPILVYPVLIGLGILALLQLRLSKSKVASETLYSYATLLYSTIVLENLYYGAPRFWPETYDFLAWFWPGVLLFKVSYCIAFAGIILSFQKAER
jgi:hypothetical protein